jgi:hypothetical protein
LAATGFPCFLTGGAGFRATALALGLAVATRFAAELFRAGAAFFTALLLAAAVGGVFALVLGALRAGAFSDDERLTIGLRRAFLPANARFFAEDAGEL